VVRRTFLSRLATTLLGAAAAALVHAQPQAPTTEGQARYYVYGAFLTHAVPEIMGDRVALGPELEQRLGLTSGADRLTIYDALMIYTDGKPLAVRKASADEIARYKPQAKRELKDPLFAVQAGDITLLVEYDMQANTIPFVGQIGVAYQPPRAAAPVVEQRSAPAVAPIAPKPPAARRAPPPAPAEALKPSGPCVVGAVMSEQDLANCRAAPGGAARVQPGPPVVIKPQVRVAPPPPAPARSAPCEVKPVMSEEDLANCRAAPGGAARVQAGPPIVTKPQARAETAPPQKAGPCVVKPVMSEEDLANCREAPGGAARVQPGPPIVIKPQARTEPAPQRAAPCEIKAVMSEEDLANCRAAPGGAARVQPGPPIAPRSPSAVAPEPERRPATPCVIKPVMSEEDQIACGIRSR
jgi:hypothetical protein